MSQDAPSPEIPPCPDDPASPADLTDLVFRIFRANGRLLTAGDELVAPLGLTSARWQVLGEIAAGEPRPVAHLARDLGVSRQAVQRIANELSREGIVVFRPNPLHKRARLVAMTEAGSTLFARALDLQRPWAGQLVAGLEAARIAKTCAMLDELMARLDALGSAEPAGGDSRGGAVTGVGP